LKELLQIIEGFTDQGIAYQNEIKQHKDRIAELEKLADLQKATIDVQGKALREARDPCKTCDADSNEIPCDWNGISCRKHPAQKKEPEMVICPDAGKTERCAGGICFHKVPHRHSSDLGCDLTTCGGACIPVDPQPNPVPTSGTGTAPEGATVEHMQTERTCKICKHPTCPQRTTSSNAYKVCIADGSFVDKEPEQDECTYPGMAKDIEDLCGRVKILEERVDTNDRSIL
ncbi:MAG: hypothetical protein ABR999_10810, partial [Methanoregula sp.]|uniref:hypothetical protein n=1 Tax=Methanoregula sp. TaxID=2052170 RepID=UPI003D0F23B7